MHDNNTTTNLVQLVPNPFGLTLVEDTLSHLFPTHTERETNREKIIAIRQGLGHHIEHCLTQGGNDKAGVAMTCSVFVPVIRTISNNISVFNFFIGVCKSQQIVTTNFNENTITVTSNTHTHYIIQTCTFKKIPTDAAADSTRL